MVALSNVRFGQTNEDIRTVQKALIAPGHNIPAGAAAHFGEGTRAAYRAEQLAQGFTGAHADGTLAVPRSSPSAATPASASTARVPRHSPVGRLSLSQVMCHDPQNDFGEAAMRRYAGTTCRLTGRDPKFGAPTLVTITKRESVYNHPKVRVNDRNSNARSAGARRAPAELLPGRHSVHSHHVRRRPPGRYGHHTLRRGRGHVRDDQLRSRPIPRQPVGVELRRARAAGGSEAATARVVDVLRVRETILPRPRRSPQRAR
jgi:peptidoglycan hydrolase-like protein with peptidoglycan-binding domain